MATVLYMFEVDMSEDDIIFPKHQCCKRKTVILLSNVASLFVSFYQLWLGVKAVKWFLQYTNSFYIKLKVNGLELNVIKPTITKVLHEEPLCVFCFK